MKNGRTFLTALMENLHDSRDMLPSQAGYSFIPRERGPLETRLVISRLDGEWLIDQISRRTTMINTATLVKWVRDPRSGEVHLPSEEVTIIGVMRNLDRTLMKVRWQAGGDCVVFPEELAEIHQN